MVLIMLTLTLTIYEVQGQELNALEVVVMDNDGKLRPNIEVIIANETFRKSFKSGTNGIAVFRLLSPGRYAISVIIEGIRVGYTEVDFPSMQRVELKLQLGALKCKIVDVDGYPVEGLSITIRSESGKITKTGKTASDGIIVINDLPFSSLPGIGKYFLSAKLQNLTVINKVIDYPVPSADSLEVVAEVAKLGIKISDASGDPLQGGELLLLAKNYSASFQVKDGEVMIGEMPTSNIAGTYTAKIVLKYPAFGKNLEVLSDTFMLERYTNKTYTIDVDKLVINILDEENNPVSGIKVLLQSAKFGNLTYSLTGRDGKATFSVLPYSIGPYGAGEYEVVIIKDNNAISMFKFSFTPTQTSISHTLYRKEVTLRFVKPNNEPLNGALIKLRDPLTGASSEAVTDENGVAVFRVIPGRQIYSVTYLGDVVESGEINIMQEQAVIIVKGVDINVVLKIIDWFGLPVKDLEIVAYKGGEKLQVTKEGVGEYSIIAPSRGIITIDIYQDGNIIERRRILVIEPAIETIRLRGISMAGRLMSMDTVATIIASIFFVFTLAFSVVLFLKKARPRPAEKK